MKTTLIAAFAGLIVSTAVQAAEEEVVYKPGGEKRAAVWKAFYDENQAEGDMMDPLVVAGPKMIPEILEAISHKDMQRRRYAIGALGNLGDERPVEPLEAIVEDEKEEDYFRSDALESIYKLDAGRAKKLAEKFAKEGDLLKVTSAAILKEEPWLLDGLTPEAPEGDPADARVYVIDQDPDGLIVRARPGNGAVIGTLPRIDRPDALMVHIVAEDAETGWVLFDLAETNLGETPWAGLGWIPGEALATHTKGTGGKAVPLYETPDGKGEAVGTVPADSEVTILGCRGKALKVKQKDVTGWLLPESQCANPEGGCK